MDIQTTVTYDGKTYIGEWGTIKSTHLGYESHGIFTLYAELDYGGSGQSFGGYALDQYDKTTDQRWGTDWGLEFIKRVMWVVGVSKWEEMVGQRVLALREDYLGSIKAIISEDQKRSFFFDDLVIPAPVMR